MEVINPTKFNNLFLDELAAADEATQKALLAFYRDVVAKFQAKNSKELTPFID